MDDFELLRQYVESGSQEAFAGIVRRYVDMVYSSARRQLRSADRAEDVTQQVFIALAKKARSLDRNVIVGGWLLQATRYAVANERRLQTRRIRHEREAAMEHAEAQTPNWNELEGVFDEAIAQLPEGNRDALVLRYFEGRSVRETAQRLGISEDAAKQRVCRGVDQLRSTFSRRGITVSASALTALLATEAVKAAPAGLAASTISAAGAKIASVGLFKGAALLTWLKANAVAAVLVGGILAGSAVVAVHAVLEQGKAQDPGPVVKVAAAQPTLSGVVKTEDGRAVPNAQVILATEQHPISAYTPDKKAPTTLTDDQGRFSFPPMPGKSAVLVVADEGWAEADGDKLGGDIVLQKWGRLEGTVRHGSKPVPGARVYYSRWGNNERLIRHDISVVADENGHYELPHLIKGEGYVSRDMSKGRMGLDFVHFTYVQIEPGKTVTADLGGTGRDVIGSADGEMGQPKINWTNERGYSTDCSVQWVDHQSKQHSWSERFNVEPDGTFRIEDVPPGRHKIIVRRLIVENAFGEDVAYGELDVNIPDEQSDEPLDVGVIRVKAIPHLVVGDAAPEVAGKTLDGKAVKLSDFKGKFVLMHFWSPIYSNSMEDLAQIKAIHEEFGEQLVVLGWSMEDRPELMKKTVAEKGIDWPCGYLGKWENAPQVYFRSPSHCLLIGPDGKVLAKNLGGYNKDSIRKAVVKFVK